MTAVRFAATEAGGNVAVWAHIGGFAVGAGTAAVIRVVEQNNLLGG